MVRCCDSPMPPITRTDPVISQVMGKPVRERFDVCVSQALVVVDYAHATRRHVGHGLELVSKIIRHLASSHYSSRPGWSS